MIPDKLKRKRLRTQIKYASLAFHRKEATESLIIMMPDIIASYWIVNKRIESKQK